jgi:hypothetical protein
MKRMVGNNHLMWRLMTGAGLLVAGLLAGSGCARFAGVAASRPRLTYDEVINAAEQVRTCSYVEQHPDGTQAVCSTTYMQDPGCFRYVVAREGNELSIDIINWNTGHHLQLMPPSAACLNLMPARPVQANGPSLLAGQLKQWAVHASAIPQGRTHIDGRPADGFLFEAERPFTSVRAIVWADVETRLPVRVETFSRYKAEDPTGRMSGNRHEVLSDFTFNAPLDQALFSVTPPEGYTVVTQDQRVAVAPPPATEATLVEGLKLWAGLNSNMFPDELTNLALVHVMLRTEVSDRKNNQTLVAMYGALEFVRQHHLTGRPWRYTGKGVKLDEKDRPVFQYQPVAAGPFHVIYADLSIREVPADQLPSAPAPAPAAETNQPAKSLSENPLDP